MIAQKSGKIINISSNATFYGTPESGAYAASKAGINQLTKTMAIEWGPHNIQVNAICPGLTNTKLLQEVWDNPKNAELLKKFLNKVPLGRFMEPNELAALVLFLAGSGSGYINGAMFQIDDGARYNPY
jgi:NAD(P)-dependent dehydrogenase (short-subunit alcohol dehydrogenase family)